jgi:hypothetical protein
MKVLLRGVHPAVAVRDHLGAVMLTGLKDLKVLGGGR